MRSRSLVISSLAVVALALTGCGDSGKITPKASSGDSTATTEAAGSVETVPSSDETIPGVGEIPDLPDVGDIPGVDGVMEDCITASAIYTSMMSGLTGATLSAEDQAGVEELRAKLPADIQDDFDVITAAIAKISSDGLIAGSQAMGTPEFTTAQENLSAYFTEMCADVSPGG